MNHRSLHRPTSCSGSSASGFVLVTVLIVLVLLVVLVVAFLLRVTTERNSATGFRSSASARELADMAVGIVQGQIGLATAQGPTNVWVSQPGMVRTYNSSGTLYNAFKLYSATNMIVGSPADLGIVGGVSPDLPPSTWTGDTALWTDLNSPVQTPSGVNVYPILDPSATNATGPSGFSITPAPGETANLPVMPVRWLYVLEDGSLIAPDATSSGTKATFGANGARGETPGNKIIGRIAFWTDDNSCRVNINTASTGTFWDVPHSYSTLPAANNGLPTAGTLTQEQGYGYFQPAQKEFQRYPGNPAMTDLRAVFPSLPQTNIYNIVPRVAGGGSTQGTVAVAATAASILTPKTYRLYANEDEMIFNPVNRGPNPISPGPALTLAQLQAAKFFLTAQSRAPEVNLFGLPRIACWPINVDFDPLNNPTSPYTTAFDRLIAFCSTTGDTTTTGKFHPYYFQRQNSLSATNDINLGSSGAVLGRNQQLYSYLQYLTGQNIPGFGGNFAAKYLSPGGGLASDRDQILTEVFDYIRSLNLYDTTLADTTGAHAFTPTAKGCVVPTVNGSGTGTTMGFGRYYTLSQLGIGFICNADASNSTSNTPEADLSPNPSNTWRPLNKGGNRVLGGQALPPGKEYIQAIIVPEFFSPAYGFIALTPDMNVTITGLSKLTINGVSLFPSAGPNPADPATITYANNTAGSYPWSGGTKYGGRAGFRYFTLGSIIPVPSNATPRPRTSWARGFIPDDPGLASGVNDPYPFIGTPIIIPNSGTMLFDSSADITVTISDPSNKPLQTINIKFPTATLPVPKLVDQGTPAFNDGAHIANATPMQSWWAYTGNGVISDGYSVPKGQGNINGLVAAGRLASAAQWMGTVSGTQPFTPASIYAGALFWPGYDVLQTVLPANGDYRLVAGRSNVPDTVFLPHPLYGQAAMASSISNESDTRYDPGFDNSGRYLNSTLISKYPAGHEPEIPSNATQTPQSTGDYDDPLPDAFPGPFINKPDEGSDVITTGANAAKSIPYYNSMVLTTSNGQGIDQNPDGGAFFSPNRMMPSPGMFGSLPTGVMNGVPWRTLLFRPQTGHSGATSPADHLLLDLFWMPVVEPYAISDRFSTSGKINMNYQVLPFTYIKRSTGLWALFQSEMVTSMPNSLISVYKTAGSGTGTSMRHTIDSAQTLTQFESKFNTGDVFKSASEICNLHIVPTGQTVAAMPAYWTTNALTGDNVRERIYTTLYPRLTTKSNTYTVYFQAQSLKKATTSPLNTWTDGTDVVLGEYRGSAIIERFIDANNTAIPDYAADIANNGGTLPSSDQGKTLDTFYRWRIISNRQFAP